MTTENVVHFADFAKPVRTPMVCSKCGATGELEMKCGCGAEFAREVNATRKADQVAEALRDPANAAKSNRALAEELGVAPDTVDRVRKSTARNQAVDEKRVGRDGKARRAPKAPGERQRQVSIDAIDPVWEEFKAKAEAEGVSAAKKLGAIMAREAEPPKIDPSTLSMTAQQKLQAAINRIEWEYRQKFAAEIEEHLKKIVPGLQEEKNEAYREQQRWRELINNRKPIFSADQFKLILSCLHPDSRLSVSEERLGEAFRLLNGKKLQLTKEQ